MSSAASGADRVRCPKCAAELPEGAAACRACGLSAERFETFERDAIEATPDVLAAWQACVVSWDEEAAHERFRAAAAGAGAFAFAASAYRQVARERGDDARAADGLSRVQRMAEAALLVRPLASHEADGGARHRRRPYRAASLLVLVFLLLASLGLVAAIMIRALPDQPDERPTTRSRRQRERPPEKPSPTAPRRAAPRN